MTVRLQRKRLSATDSVQQQQVHLQMSGAKAVQHLLKPKIHLWLQSPCQCLVCIEQKPLIKKQQDEIKEYLDSSKKSHEWLKKILIGLTQSISKTLKLFLPDVLYVVGDGLEIFSTNKKDYRIIKFAGTTPVKAVFNTMTRLKKQYKGMLEQNFRKTMIDKINPRFMHVKYYDKLLPSHFHDGDGSITLEKNKSKFKTYILHNNSNYIISAIEQHKMNEKQPFATIRYAQGNFQLLNQKQFELFSIMKLPEDIVYVQSFIKSKQSEAIVISKYSQNNPKCQTDKILWKKAELYVMVLLGGLGKYDEGYDELQNFQDENDQLMKQNPQSYALLMTYQIIHFLSMATNIYIRHIKIKWIINDIFTVYLQEIIQFDTDQISKRPIRYKLPPASEISNFYQDSDFFVQVHRQMRKIKQQNLIKVRKQLRQKSYSQAIDGTNSSLASKNSQKSIQQNPEIHDSLKSSNLIFKRLAGSKKRNISNLDSQSIIYEQNKMSINTKVSTNNQNSKNFSTINTRRSISYNFQSNKKADTMRNSIEKQDHHPKQRRSISSFGFGDVITRYGEKLIEREKKRLNQSVNRYDKRKQQSKDKNQFSIQLSKKPKQYRATIDFSQLSSRNK